ncbi:MAG: N-acetylglucosamine-6-phosphate deacetylase [Verrucomicrobiota bacterium]|nr:N-acetylglucosamine-6-phosphate deacetylase [Verrucomicrobiota bacterium]
MKPFDLQVNGYAGVDFCASELEGEELELACRALDEDGVDGILATIITDSLDRMEAKLARLVSLREQCALGKKMIAGIHIEGPFISPITGYVGAHPREAVVEASLDGAKRLLDAAGGLTRVFTLAPECDPGMATTRFLSNEGVAVSAGHCDPTLETLKEAIENGLSMVTHFGNGCPVDLPRHDNVLQRFLHFRDRLWFCFIPDGAHVDFVALGNYIDYVGVERSIAVTDAICASRLGPGRYELSGMEIEVDDDGVARKPGSSNLAGSTVTMPRMKKHLSEGLGLSESKIEQLIDRNPRSVIER